MKGAKPSKPKMFTSKSFTPGALMGGGKKEDPSMKPPKPKGKKMPFSFGKK